jgi:hypothetical protein
MNRTPLRLIAENRRPPESPHEPHHPNYAKDFHAWATAQADLLRIAAESRDDAQRLLRAIGGLDFPNLSEELDGLARREQGELRKRLATIVEHLLKLQHSPEPNPQRGWQNTVRRSRVEVARLLKDSPSLKPLLPSLLAAAITDVLAVLPHELAAIDKAKPALLSKAMRESARNYTAQHVQDFRWLPASEREEQAPVTRKPARRKGRDSTR